MDLLLVLEHHFYKDNNNDIWCDRVVNREFIERYLSVFENITICARINTTTKIEGEFHKVSGDRTNFLELPDFTGFKQMLIKLPRIIQIFKREYKNYSTIIFRAPSPLSLVLYRYCINRSKVGVEFVMGADKFFPNKSVVFKFINKLLVSEAQKLCLKANGVSYVTSEELQKTYPSYSIKYGEDSHHFDSSYSSVDLKDSNYKIKDWSSDNKPELIRISHVGYMDSDRKGHEILINAVALLIAKGYNIQLTFIGDGNLRSKFEDIARKLELDENIIFYGSTNNKIEIVNILSESHLFVLPSKSEGLPRVIIEAMAASNPCIASGVDGIPELLDEECIVNSFNFEDYALKIEELISDWEKMIMYSIKNYEKAQQFHEKVLNSRRKAFYLKLNTINYEHNE